MKGHVIYRPISHILDSKDREKLKKYGRRLKKVIRNFRRQNENFLLKKVIEKVLVRGIFSVSPKLGTKSPPMTTPLKSGDSDSQPSSIDLYACVCVCVCRCV